MRNCDGKVAERLFVPNVVHIQERVECRLNEEGAQEREEDMMVTLLKGLMMMRMMMIHLCVLKSSKLEVCYAPVSLFLA